MKFKAGLMAMLIIGSVFCGRAQPAPSPPPAATNGAAPAETIFSVSGYRVKGNTVLPPEKFDFLTNYAGPAITYQRVIEGLGQLQLLYRNLGFATISVTLPPQSLTDGMVEVRVIEGKLESINIVSNRYFSTENIRRALPSLTTNILLNTKWLQPELDRANLNPDRQIYPVIGPGLDPGTSDLTLDLKDRPPLHGHIELNDKSTPDTPLLRIDSALQYNNLWQLNHQLGVEYNFSPQTYKPDDYLPRFYDQPMVDSYSAFYRLPLGSGGSYREAYESLPVDFGYDQVTHSFNLPPPSGSPEFIFYASRSASETGLRYSPLTSIVNNSLVQIGSQSAEQDLTFTGDIGAKFTLPQPEIAGLHSAVSFGVDFKSYRANSYSTNLSYFTTTNLTTGSTQNSTVALPGNTYHALVYAPLSVGWSGDRTDPRGSWSFHSGLNLFLAPLASTRTNFQAVAGSPAAGGNYASFSAGVIREEKLPDNWSVLLRAEGNWATEPLISNEEFPLGGTGGMRGYQEGEYYSGANWRLMSDLRAPPINIGSFPQAGASVPAFVRPSVFMDYGEGYGLANSLPPDRQWGTGFGLFLTAGQHFDARLTLAWALQSTPTTSAGGIQAYFSVGTQF